MRRLAEAERIQKFMRALGAAARDEARVYFTGGASAVLLGWRATTVDVDLAIVPDRDELLRALPALKIDLALNIELASPADFIPELPGWEDRSVFILREGKVGFYHFDFHAQALAKIERGHTQDLADVDEMLNRGLVEPRTLRRLFEEIVTRLHRFPAVDPNSFRRALDEALAGLR
jgi:hypothetical protein